MKDPPAVIWNFLYLCILPRAFEDLGGSSGRLLTHNEECTQALVNLLLIGRCVSGVSNTDEIYDEEGKKLVRTTLNIGVHHSRGQITEQSRINLPPPLPFQEKTMRSE